eukprot:COSAG06_NODE_69275_length_198_cov_23.202020_1_plen_37_part_10
MHTSQFPEKRGDHSIECTQVSFQKNGATTQLNVLPAE